MCCIYIRARRYEQAGNKGRFGLRASETCQAVVYDWPLLQGYINRENKTAEDTCFQCPGKSRLVGAVLNADPYGIAMTQVLMSMCSDACSNVHSSVEARGRMA